MKKLRLALTVSAVLAVLLSVIIGVHVYLARRLIVDLDLAPQLRGVLLVTIGLLAASLVCQPIAQRWLSRSVERAIAWPAAVWMGLAFYLLLGLAISDVVWWAAGTTALADVGGLPHGTAAVRARAVAVLGLALVATIAALRVALRGPVVRRVELRLPRWPRARDGYRVVQISDLHIGPILGRRFAARVVESCNSLQPDLVAVTGDVVDGGVRQLADEVAPLGRLAARDGVFFVTGNHDYYSGADGWVQRMAALGMRVLRNARITIGAGDAAFELAGVDDFHGDLFGGHGGADVPRALTGRDPQRPVVLMSHDPATFPQAAQLGVDLQLSGHTHGGQIWPFKYLVRLSTPFVAGHYRGDDAQLYVSRGTGFWGPPMRLFAPAEITELILRSA